MKSKYLILIFFITNISCNDVGSTEFQFEETKELTSRAINVGNIASFRYPFRIRQNDSTLYVLDLHGREYYTYQLSYPSLVLKEEFAIKGNGPEEFLSVENIRLSSSNEIYLLDSNKATISIYNSNKDSILKEIKLPDKLLRSLDFALINDSLFAITDYTGKCRVHIVDNEGNIKKQLFRIPMKRKHNDVYDVVLAQAWRSFIDYNPANGILAMATQLGQVIEIYNLKTNETVKILYGKFGEPKFANKGSYAIPNGIMGYSDIHVGNEAIYTIFWGTSFKDIQKEPFNTVEGGNKIQVFSLDGKPMKQYILDRHITGFSVNEREKKLIGLDVNNDNQIIEYQL